VESFVEHHKTKLNKSCRGVVSCCSHS